jgi:hypothetical protein
MNDWTPAFSEDQLVEFVLGIATSAVTKEAATAFFVEFSSPPEAL